MGVVAENGTVVEPGGVYLTFSGDPGRPYKLAKVVRVGESRTPRSAAGRPPAPDLWVKLHQTDWAEPPAAGEGGPFTIQLVSADMFLGWGPPRLPIRVGTEAITADELAAAGRER